MEIVRPTYAYAGFSVRNPIKGLPALEVIGEVSNVPARDPLWHSHPSYEFVYIMRGISSLKLKDQTLMVQTGQMTVTYPGEFHAVNGATEAKTHFLWTRLVLENLGSAGVKLAEKLRRNRVRLLYGAFDLEPALRGLLRQATRRESGFEQVMRTQVQMIIALLMQRADATDGPDPHALPAIRLRRRSSGTVYTRPLKRSARADQPYSVEVGQAIHFMENVLDRRLSMTEIAGASSLSASHLYHRFRKEIGTSPHAYHLNLRLNAAKDALTHPDMSVVAVARMFGFSSGQHFSTAFSNALGVSPRQWKRHAGAAERIR